MTRTKARTEGARRSAPRVVAVCAAAVIGATAVPALAVHEPPSGTIGTSRWAVVLCRFPDQDVPHEPKWYAGFFGPEYPGVGHYWDHVSYGRLTLDASVHGWFTLPRPSTYYEGDPDAPSEDDRLQLTDLKWDCQRAADAAVDFADYDGIAFWFNGSFGENAPQGFGGKSFLIVDEPGRLVPAITMSDPTSWDELEQAEGVAVTAHEMGHGFGFDHSGNDPQAEYGSDWDVMSNMMPNCNNFNIPGPCEPIQPIAYWKEYAGWISSEHIFTPEPGTRTVVRLDPLSRTPAEGAYSMARIPYRGRDDTYFTVEARLREGYDARLPADAVLVHLVRKAMRDVYIVTNDANTGGGEYSAFHPGDAFAQEDSGVRVEVLTRNDDGSFDVAVTQPAPTTRRYRRGIDLEIEFFRRWRAEAVVRFRDVEDAPRACRRGTIIFQRKTGREWGTVRELTLTNHGFGRFQFHDPRGQQAHRVVAPELPLGWDVCEGAVSRTLYR